jgi:site-specific DNA recombinase
MDTLRVVGYVRVSSQEQADEGISLSAQRSRIAAWCDASGAELGEVVEDAGVGGAVPLENRPSGYRVAQLLDARRPGVDALVVTALDRLGRDAGATLTLLRRFAGGPLGLVSLSERLDLSTAHGRALAGVACVFGELERSLISERTSQALSQLRASGRVYSRPPYGFDVVEDRLAKNPVEQRVLTTIRRLRSRGLSYARIAASLNSRSIRAKRGGPWHSTGVRSVVLTSKRLENETLKRAA